MLEVLISGKLRGAPEAKREALRRGKTQRSATEQAAGSDST